MIVNKKELADITGYTERTLTNWQHDGLPIDQVGGMGGQNRYDTAKVLRWLLQREQLRAVKTEEADNEISGIEAERERKTRLEADLLQIEYDVEIGKLIPATDIENAWVNLVTNFKTKTLAIPSRISSAVAVAEDIQEIEDLLTKEIEDALTELSKVDNNEDAEE